jgi:hypothetical protein
VDDVNFWKQQLFAMRVYQDWIFCQDVNLTEWENNHISLEWDYVWFFFLFLSRNFRNMSYTIMIFHNITKFSSIAFHIQHLLWSTDWDSVLYSDTPHGERVHSVPKHLGTHWTVYGMYYGKRYHYSEYRMQWIIFLKFTVLNNIIIIK